MGPTADVALCGLGSLGLGSACALAPGAGWKLTGPGSGTLRGFDGRGAVRSELTALHDAAGALEFARGVRTVSSSTDPWYLAGVETFDPLDASGGRTVYSGQIVDSWGRLTSFELSDLGLTRTFEYEGPRAVGDAVVDGLGTARLWRDLWYDAAGRLRGIEAGGAGGGRVEQHLAWGTMGRLQAEWLGTCDAAGC